MDSHRSKHHIHMRSFCCNLAAAFTIIGLFFLTCAIVLYIFATTDPNVGKIFQDLLEKATFESSQTYSTVGPSNRLPMFIASGIGAIGIALVIIAILFICVSCVSASECFNNGGCEFRARKSIQEPADKLRFEEHDKFSNQEHEQPLIARSPNFNRHIPVAIDEIENGSFEEGNRKSIVASGDFNQICLPINTESNVRHSTASTMPQCMITQNGVWIPPNGFTYLKNPSDLENFYQESRASGRFKKISQDDQENKTILV